MRMLSYEVESAADPERLWSLIAEPRRWHEWAPHVRSPRGLGDPQVEANRSGTLRLGGALPVSVRIIGVEPGRSWSWRVGPVEVFHEVEPRPAGALARIEISAPRPLEAALRLGYGPLVALLLRNLARVAEREG